MHKYTKKDSSQLSSFKFGLDFGDKSSLSEVLWSPDVKSNPSRVAATLTRHGL
jgi:hypothetical protein